MSLKKPLIVVKYTGPLREMTITHIKESMKFVSESLGAELVVTDELMDLSVHDNSIHESINSMITTVKELIESNDRLTKALIESYSEPEDEVAPRTYMDGSEVK